VGTQVRGHGPRPAGPAPAGAAPVHADPRGAQRALLPQDLRGPGHRPRRLPLPVRPGPPALHHQGRAPRGLPLRLLRRAPARGGAPARLLGHHGQGHGGGLHRRGPEEMGRAHGARPGHGRRHPRGRGADRLQLRALHRRLRLPPGRRDPGRGRGAGLQRKHPPPGGHHAGLQDQRARVHPQLRPLPGPDHGRPGRQRQRAEPALRALRGRELVRGGPDPDRGAPQAHGHGQLRPLRGHGPGRGRRMPGAPGHAHQRGPLPGRNR